MFSKTILNDIRDRIPIAVYIGEHVPLKRAGRSFKGLCPFHNEKTPSFRVSDEKGIYHCFGCGESGDLFQFVIKFEGASFAEAVKMLAARAGIEIPRDISPNLAKEDEILRKKRLFFRINELARDWFRERLGDSRAGVIARRYLQDRGLSEEIWTQHFLGFADNSWDRLALYLKEKGVPLELAAELGLIKRREGGGYYDFFRNRVIFPIVSTQGDVLGFSGRTLEGGEVAKYLNSPDSSIYHKSNCLYGLNRAAASIRNLDRAILVEGNIDLLSLHQVGIVNVVAPLGTALTSGHVRVLLRQTRNITVVFDGDAAGTRAALRSLEIFLDEGLSPRMVSLPHGEDPDSLVRKEGVDAFKKRIDAASSLFEYFVECVIGEVGSDATGKIAAIRKIMPFLKRVTDVTERGIYIRYVARRLDVEERSIERAVVQGKKGEDYVFTSVVNVSSKRSDEIVMRSAERMLVEVILSHPLLAEEVLGGIDVSCFEDSWCRTVIEFMVGGWRREGKFSLNLALDTLADPELASQLRELSLCGEMTSLDEARNLVRDCMAHIKGRKAKARLVDINADIRRAEIEGDEKRLMALLSEKLELVTQVKSTTTRRME